jgi:2-desacetyl-2-hydroxyethyl bacteriochlorophyllide A dehydrogenase
MRRSLYFTAPREVEVMEEKVPELKEGEVLVRSLLSAISGGTEMLLYRGQVERGTRLDTTIKSLGGSFVHPFKYGYATVGEVVATGEGVACAWVGKKVFCFHSHESEFTIPIADAMAVPPGVSDEDALFLPSMETALSLVMDAAPLVGENVVVLGQGVIGLLTTSLLARMPLSALIAADRFPLRRERSMELGADLSLDPSGDARQFLVSSGLSEVMADLVFELSGEPAALEFATHLAGMEARIVVGSWYGNKEMRTCLGDDFHRNRLRIISSQVSRIDGSLSGRWSKSRRLGVAWKMIRMVRPARLISHRFKIADAAGAYRLLDSHGQEAVQVVLDYREG